MDAASYWKITVDIAATSFLPGREVIYRYRRGKDDGNEVDKIQTDAVRTESELHRPIGIAKDVFYAKN